MLGFFSLGDLSPVSQRRGELIENLPLCTLITPGKGNCHRPILLNALST